MRDGHPDEQARPACVIGGYDAPQPGFTDRETCIVIFLAPAICVRKGFESFLLTSGAVRYEICVVGQNEALIARRGLHQRISLQGIDVHL